MNKTITSVVFSLAMIGTLHSQQNYYVDINSGNNANPGTITQPVRTIQAGLDLSYSNPGVDTVNVLEGVYREHVLVDHDVHLEAMPNATLKLAVGASEVILIGGTSALAISSETEITGFKLEGSGSMVGIRVVGGGLPCSPRIAWNSITGFQAGIQVESAGPSVVVSPTINGNSVTGHTVLGLFSGVGLAADPIDGGSINVESRANRYQNLLYGIRMAPSQGPNPGLVSLQSYSDLIAKCIHGAYANSQYGAVSQTMLHTTITNPGVIGFPPNPTSGIESLNGSVIVVGNSIVSLNSVTGTDLLADATSFIFEVGAGPFGLAGTSSNFIGSANPGSPGFVSIALGDYHLLQSSILVDQADLSLVAPGASNSVPTDADGSPRVSDGNFLDGNPSALPDVGAFEFSEASLDFQNYSGTWAGYDPSTQPLVQMNPGSSVSYHLSGPPLGNYVFVLDPVTTPVNFLSPIWGNQLIVQSVLPHATGLLDATGLASGVLVYPLGTSFPEMRFAAQAWVSNPLLTEGGYTRRIELELSE